MKRLTTILLLTLACALAATAGAPEKKLAGNDLFGEPAKELAFIKLKYLSKAEAIVIPTLYLDLMTYGKGTARTETSGLQRMAGKTQSTVKAKAEAFIPVDGARARALATRLYDDLVARLRAEGWTVYTWADVEGSDALAKMELDEPSEEYGEPKIKFNDGIVRRDYLRFAPEGLPVFENNLTGPLFKMKKLAAEKKANLLLPVLEFDLAQVQLSSERSYSSLSASAGVAPELTLTSINYTFLNPKYAGGGVMSRPAKVLSEEAGRVTEQEDVSPEFANALSESLAMLTGTGSIKSSHGLYVMEPDWAVVEASVAGAGEAVNDVVARAMGLYLKK